MVDGAGMRYEAGDTLEDGHLTLAPELEQGLRIIGQELRPVEHLRGLRDVPIDAQSEPVEDVADVQARAG